METIAYFLDKNTFEILDVVQLADYEINLDEETNAKTTMTVLQKLNASDRDFVFIKEKGKIIYIGIIEAPTNEDGKTKHNINATYVTNLFDRKIILKNENLIATKGIEDFIEYTIKNDFTESEDTILNKTFIDIEVKTHTPKNFSVQTENGIYNFHTFMSNCTQNYNIIYDFQVINKRLKITIYKSEETEDLIDTNVSDISEYYEKFETNVVSKVTVLTPDGTETNYYLLTDRTTTQNKDDENRAIGDVVVVYEENQENVEETALNQFKSNSYSHLIEFNININSTLFEVENWHIGKPIKIKSKSNNVINTYISGISRGMNARIWKIKTGNIRITLLDRLKQEKKKEEI